MGKFIVTTNNEGMGRILVVVNSRQMSFIQVDATWGKAMDTTDYKG